MSASAIALSSGRGTLFFMICKKNVIGKTKQQNIFGNRVGEGIEKIIAAIAFWIPMSISDFKMENNRIDSTDYISDIGDSLYMLCNILYMSCC